MKHIRLWDYSEKKYKTIAENEKMEEFTEVKNINELWEYMTMEVPEDISNMGKLDIIGYDGTGQPTKIIYDYGNGEEKILVEKDVIGILDLFKDNSLRQIIYEQRNKKKIKKYHINVFIFYHYRYFYIRIAKIKATY